MPIGFHATAQVAVGNTRFHKYIGVHMTSHPFEQMLSRGLDHLQRRARPVSQDSKSAFSKPASASCPIGWSDSTKNI